ncbi:MAG: hypothetical protein EOP05_23085 [Proteobacteria bacterium]|nr:MAG: hypothetical protein EOP05_23085 [Pseudomonadota bacterium]
MKTVFLLFALLISMSGMFLTSSNAEAREASCGGKCVTTAKEKSWMSPNCDAANDSKTDSEKEITCRQMSGFGGCEWKMNEKKIVRKSMCMNVTNDRTLDQLCNKAEMQNEKSCLAVSRCVWSPAAVTCLR